MFPRVGGGGLCPLVPDPPGSRFSRFVPPAQPAPLARNGPQTSVIAVGKNSRNHAPLCQNDALGSERFLFVIVWGRPRPAVRRAQLDALDLVPPTALPALPECYPAKEKT